MQCETDREKERETEMNENNLFLKMISNLILRGSVANAGQVEEEGVQGVRRVEPSIQGFSRGPEP